MAKIRHIAIFSDDTEKLAGFYGDVFNLTLTGIGGTGSAWVTDGYLDVALLKRRGANAPKAGIHHWGFTAEPGERDGILARMKKFGIEPYSPYVDAPEAPRPYAEDAVKDPDGNRFDLSTGMKPLVAGKGFTPRATAASPKIRHIAIFSDDPSRLADFYSTCFGLKITGKSKSGAMWVTDGYMDVALLVRRSAKAPPRGIHHWGFTLAPEDKAGIYRKLTALGLPPSDPRAEDPTIPRPYVEEMAHDIDGNRYDLTLGMRDLGDEMAKTETRLKELAAAK